MKVEEIVAQFQVDGVLKKVEPFGNGHINDTYLLTTEGEKGVRHYILQRMNDSIFKDLDGLMENVVAVTEYLKKIIIKNDGDPDRETINIIKTKDGKNYLRLPDGRAFRLMLFVENSVCFEKVESSQDFYDSAVAFGIFQKQLSGFPAKELHETIPDFHNTPKRFQDFKKAVEEDVMGRAKYAKPEIEFALARESDTPAIVSLLKNGDLPLRVTHNDTKLNNILFDKDTKKALCVIDLDTVMPGSALYDFGDSIRFGASTGAEDEKDLSKVSLDLNLFDAYVNGFIEGASGHLNSTEIRMLPMGAKLMTYECGIRFLADYLEGDIYFKIHREGHNLDRARTQFKLVQDMEDKWDQMNFIVNQYR